jgi:hypothetical protein
MTEQPLNISNNSWNPASKDFWGPNPEKRLRKANILFITAIIGILISFLGYVFGPLFGIYLLYYSYTDQWPLFHAFCLLLAVKVKTRPGPYFRAFLVILLIWSALKAFLFLLTTYWEFYYFDDFENFIYYVFGGFMFGVIVMPAMTFLIWKQTQKKEPYGDGEIYGPSAKTFLEIASVIIIIRVIYDIWRVEQEFGYWIFDPRYLDILFLSVGPLFFWVSFTLLFVYRKEIDPWEEVTIPSPKNFSMNAYTADKLQEAKDLLDRRIITMEEFLEIKRESIGSNEIVDEHVPTIQGKQYIKTKDKITNKNVEGGSSKMKELKELTEMKEKGLISDDEYEKMKGEIIG